MRTGRSAARRTRPRTAAAIAATLVGSLLPTLPLAASAAAQPYVPPSAVSREKPVKTSDAKAKPRKADTTASKTDDKHGALPGKGNATAEVPAGRGKTVKAGKLPITVTSAGTAGTAHVEILDQDATAKAGLTGLLFTVSGVNEDSGVSVDYSSFARAAGSAFGSRLKLVRLPACALTTPQLAECRTQTALPGGNDAEAQTVKADALTAAAAGSTRVQTSSGVMVLAATAGTAGPSGTYAATPLASASTWSTSLNSGSFSWSYDMPLTPMPGGLTPQLGLDYDSGSIDGRTSNSNNQASWIGDGFSYSPGFVERSYKPCADDGAPKTGSLSPGDQCWGTDNATISFAGHAGELIPVSADEWRIKNDSGTKVVRVRDASRGNGDNDGEYFRATTPEGTTYYFGYNRLPNWTAGKPETKSVYTLPVYGNNAGEPCNGADFASSWCQQGWRWNLDLVVDTHGNDITYWYTPETNNYGRDLTPTDRTPYVRGGRLDHIEYGQQQTDIYSATVKPMARVDFGTGERCLESTAGTCDPANIDANKQYWYDTPWDQTCKDGTDCPQPAPTFFTRTRLTQVVAKTLQADGSYTPVDTWDLKHKWGTADYDYQLLLDSIQHTGSSATPAVVMPKTTFAYKQMVNRLDQTGDGRLPFVKQRLGTITDELGGQIDVNYSAAVCDWTNLPTPQTNTTRCFPQTYQASDTSPITTEWFNKYVVASVIATDRTGGAPDMVTHYSYLGDAAWHYDDEDGLTKDKLKTWSQWRGYAHARIETGGVAGMSTQADHWFLRGMDGDRSSPTDKNAKRSVTVNDGEGTTLTDDQAWAGFEYRTEQFDKPGGVILGKTVSTPWKQQTAQRVRDWGTTTANLTGTAATRSFTSLDKGAGASWRETRTNTTYDGYGRVTALEDLGDTTEPADDTCTRTTYTDNTTTWILAGVSQIETVAANCSANVNRDTQPDGTSAVLSDVRYRYDNQAYGAPPTKGDVTLAHSLKNRTGTTATYLDSSGTFDTYGRPLTATDLVSTTVFDTTGSTGPVTTASPDARTTSSTYTPAAGRTARLTKTTPPATVGNTATSQTTTTDFDLLRGLPVDSLDANNRRTDIQYDALGRTLKVWLPDRAKSNGQTPDQEFTYTIADGKPSAIATKTLDDDGSQQTAYTLYDGFARPRQSQTPGPDGGRILTDTFYDDRGNPALAYAAYYTAGAPSSTLRNVDDTTNLETQTTTAYDGLGRPVKSTLLAGNGVGTPLSSTLTEYAGDRTTITPPQGGTPTTTITDAAGHTTELRQYKSATPTGAYDATTYRYDPAGHLTRLTDPAGTVWTWSYDQHGHQTKAVDPDSGTATMRYNDRGELTSTTDGRGNTIATVYDNLGRPTETHQDSPTGPLLTSQVWDPAGNKGQLSSSTRHATVGGNTYQYKTAYSLFDALSRPTRTTVTVPSVPGQEPLAGTYTSGATYRLDGQTKTLTYPAAGNLPAEPIAFTYDSLHRPTQVIGLSDYQTGQTYSPTNKPWQTTLNGTGDKRILVTDSYEWGTQRLASSRTDQYGVTGAARAAAYTYDQAGNVTSVTDTSRSGTDRQCFTYDHLARLTEAYTPTADTCPTSPTGTTLGGPAPYWTSWTYNTNGTRATETRHDPAGNTANNATTTYTYPAATAARPHALTGTSTVTGALGAPVLESYGYDSAGNTTTRNLKPAGNRSSDETLTWNTENRLSRLAATVKTTTGNTTTTTNRSTDYLYDASGNRLIGHTLDTADPAAENWTLYLGNTELKLVKGATKATATRYYALGSATAVRTDDNKLTYQSADHHGTAEVNIDATTGATDQRHTLPFGATRGTNPATWAGNRGFLGGTTEPTGLTHLAARDYDPTTGRFISVDPLLSPTDPQALAGYTYSTNNPLTYSDPSGLMKYAGATEGGGTIQDDLCEGASCRMRYTDRKDLPNNGTYTLIYPGVAIRNDNPAFDKIRKAMYDRIAKNCAGWNHEFGCNDVTNTNAQPGSQAYDSNISQLLITKFHASCMDVGRCDASVTAGAIIGGGWLQSQFGNFNAEGYSRTPKPYTGNSGWSAGTFKGQSSKLQKEESSQEQGAATTCEFNSFPAGTEVLLADGATAPIETLKVGDTVLAADPETGQASPQRIDATIATPDDRGFTTLTLEDTGSITATDHHPFWLETRKSWVEASDVQAGEALRTSSGTISRVVATRHSATLLAAYNLTVNGVHTYYVLAGETPVLVHNSNCLFGAPLREGIFGQSKAATQSRIQEVVDFYDMNGRPPAMTHQGGRRGRPAGEYGNGNGQLPDRPLGYYTESDVWPSGSGTGNRGAERLVFGRKGEVYYTSNHYENFIRLR
ncbi:polymorphic toxin-type HINT domain-containing protein [Kitasatospora sp. NPDC001540]|uniref:polymorphic toxin-type HINT domain-containing protein n=1 Tax=Kitasatospora sp. NPDC001540 TaxID=3364014 RepID=UPI0036AED951